jgi:hypothetical protein
VLLIDRAMSASLSLLEAQLLPALLGCMLLAQPAEERAEGGAALEAMAATAGVDGAALAQLQEQIKESLGGDCSTLSALRWAQGAGAGGSPPRRLVAARSAAGLWCSCPPPC